MKKRVKRFTISMLLWLPQILILLALGLVIGASFMSSSEITASFLGEKVGLHLLPQDFSVEQYSHILLQTPEFLLQFWNSLFLTLPILIGLVIVSTLGGYGFAKFSFRFKKPLFFILMLVMLLPYQVTLVPNFIVLNQMDLIGSRWAIILTNIFNPFGVFLMHQFMLGIPYETIEAARVEGASEFKIFTRIVLPQSTTGIAALVVLNVLDTWNLVEQPLILLQKEELYPLSITLNSIGESQYGIVFSCCVIFLIPLVLTFFAGKDALVEGIDKSML